MTTLGLNYLNYAEQRRSNLAKEAEQHRANLENEDRARAALSEEIRRNMKSESQRAEELAEKHRASTVSESQRSTEIDITRQKFGLDADTLAEKIREFDLQMEFNRDKLENEAWNKFSSAVQQAIPGSVGKYVSLGAATSGLKGVLGDTTVVDTAIDDIVSELAAILSPEGEERDATISDLTNIDSAVRQYASNTVGALVSGLSVVTNAKLFDQPSQLGAYIKANFRGMAEGLRKLIPSLKGVGQDIQSKWSDLGEMASNAVQKAVDDARKLGKAINERGVVNVVASAIKAWKEKMQ